MLIFFVDDYSHKFHVSFFRFLFIIIVLVFFSLLLNIRKVYFFQICLIWLFAILCSYLHQHKILQSWVIYDTEYRKVDLEDNKNKCQYPLTLLSSLHSQKNRCITELRKRLTSCETKKRSFSGYKNLYFWTFLKFRRQANGFILKLSYLQGLKEYQAGLVQNHDGSVQNF
jgi:hypothetical protein